jgi:uncharacterized membrane protein
MPILTKNSLELTNTLIQAYKNENFLTNFNVSEQKFPVNLYVHLKNAGMN